jgi:hypothetical protein
VCSPARGKGIPEWKRISAIGQRSRREWLSTSYKSADERKATSPTSSEKRHRHVSGKKLNVSGVSRPLPEPKGASGHSEVLGANCGAEADTDVQQRKLLDQTAASIELDASDEEAPDSTDLRKDHEYGLHEQSQLESVSEPEETACDVGYKPAGSKLSSLPSNNSRRVEDTYRIAQTSREKPVESLEHHQNLAGRVNKCCNIPFPNYGYTLVSVDQGRRYSHPNDVNAYS